MIRLRRSMVAVLAAVCLVAVGCSSSSKGSSSSTSGGGATASNPSKTFKIGLLADLTGAASSGFSLSVYGLKAGVALAKDEGWNIQYVTADTTSTPAGTLAAAQKLVEQDHVVAVVANSQLNFAAAPYLSSHHIPVVGLALDGPEWITDTNMFSVGGPIRTNVVPSTFGKFFKMLGGTVVGTLGYGITPASYQYAAAVADSAKAAGLKVGYENTKFAFDSTNVQPVALAMKDAHVDSIYAPIVPSTAFTLLAALKQVGATPKIALFSTGYGADLTQGGPDAVTAAQGVYFTIGSEPVEMHTAATERFQKYLRQVGASPEPGLNEYNTYEAVGLLLQAVKSMSSPITTASMMTALSNIHSWDNLGLWGGKTIDINNRSSLDNGPDNCTYMVKLVGKNFQLVPGADPICGPLVPGVTVPTQN